MAKSRFHVGMAGIVFGLSAAAALAAAGPAGAATTFLSMLDDIPLAPGLAEARAQALAFEGREGRILQADAQGALGAPEVSAFYRSALPALGWSELPAGAGAEWTFARGRELLVIRAAPAAPGRLDVHFTLVVRPAAVDAD